MKRRSKQIRMDCGDYRERVYNKIKKGIKYAKINTDITYRKP